MARGGSHDINSDGILYGQTGPRDACVSGCAETPEYAICQKCQSDAGTVELHSCPYDADVNDDPSPKCNCCEVCQGECCDEI